jgi:RNA polymerase sigma-70 factor (ECF subfamily)
MKNFVFHFVFRSPCIIFALTKLKKAIWQRRDCSTKIPTESKDDILALRQGSKEAFERLYVKYSDPLYNFVMKVSGGDVYLAEEIVQTTFISIWESRANLYDEGSFFSLLATIARRQLVNYNQHKVVEYIYNGYVKQLASQTHEDSRTESLTDTHLLDAYINQLVEQLPDKRRQIFIMSRRGCLTNEEIARQMGITESTVRTQLSLAIKTIKEWLAKNYEANIMTLVPFLLINLNV